MSVHINQRRNTNEFSVWKNISSLWYVLLLYKDTFVAGWITSNTGGCKQTYLKTCLRLLTVNKYLFKNVGLMNVVISVKSSHFLIMASCHIHKSLFFFKTLLQRLCFISAYRKTSQQNISHLQCFEGIIDHVFPSTGTFPFIECLNSLDWGYHIENVSQRCPFLYPHSFTILAHALKEKALRFHSEASHREPPTHISVLVADDKITC